MSRTVCPQCRRVCDAGESTTHTRVMCTHCGHDFTPGDDIPRSEWPARRSVVPRVVGAILALALLIGAITLIVWARLRP